MTFRNTYLLIALCNLLAFNALSQEYDSLADVQAQEVEELKKQLKAELADSLDNLSSNNDARFSNNENIQREKLEIEYSVKEVLFSSQDIQVDSQLVKGILAEIPEADIDNVKKEWAKFIKRKTKSIVEVSKVGPYIIGTQIEEISDNPSDVYSAINKSDYGVNLLAVFKSEGEFLTEEQFPDKYFSSKSVINEFALSMYRDAVKEDIKEEKKVMKSLEKELSKYQKQNEKKHKSIKSNEIDILSTEKTIEQNLQDEDFAIERIQEQKKKMSTLSGEPKKEVSRQIKEIKSEKKKLNKDNKSLSKKIVKYKAEIEETKREIEINLSEQDLQKSKINTQLAKVKSLEEKLVNIK